MTFCLPYFLSAILILSCKSSWSDIPPDIPPGKSPAVIFHVLAGIYSDILSGILAGIYLELAKENGEKELNLSSNLETFAQVGNKSRKHIPGAFQRIQHGRPYEGRFQLLT